jgi:prophage regulatory protein
MSKLLQKLSRRAEGERIVRLPEVSAKTGRSCSSIYADVAAGRFPAPVPIGPRAVGWLESELDEWLEARIAARGVRA